jgi:uncharacterized protein YjiS (DUF1127 family)
MTFANILLAHPLQDLMAHIQQARANHREFRAKKAIYDRTFQELSSMSHRELLDIGINSSDFENIAAEAAGLR